MLCTKESPMTRNKEELVALHRRLAGGSRALVPPSNRLGLCRIGLGAVLAVALLSASFAFADGGDDGTIQCDVSTLTGQYLAAASGRVFPPAFGVTDPAGEVSAVAAYS